MKKPATRKKSAAIGGAPARREKPGDWRAALLDEIRLIIKSAVPDVVETRKWKMPKNPAGVPVWEKAGILCTGETYKDKVKLTFADGAKLDDPSRLFNSSLDGSQRRAIDFSENDKLNARALKALFREAAAFNEAKKAKPRKAK